MDMDRSCALRSRRGPLRRGIVRVESDDRRDDEPDASFSIVSEPEGEAETREERTEDGGLAAWAAAVSTCSRQGSSLGSLATLARSSESLSDGSGGSCGGTDCEGSGGSWGGGSEGVLL